MKVVKNHEHGSYAYVVQSRQELGTKEGLKALASLEPTKTANLFTVTGWSAKLFLQFCLKTVDPC